MFNYKYFSKVKNLEATTTELIKTTENYKQSQLDISRLDNEIFQLNDKLKNSQSQLEHAYKVFFYSIYIPPNCFLPSYFYYFCFFIIYF